MKISIGNTFRKSVAGTRVEVHFPEGSWDRLRAMQRQIDATSPGEVISQALRLYEAALQEVEKGSSVLIRKDEGTEVNVFGEGEG